LENYKPGQKKQSNHQAFLLFWANRKFGLSLVSLAKQNANQFVPLFFANFCKENFYISPN
jgi:hypothetical protein